MPLSEDDKQRIREEEQFRLEVREEFRRTASPNDARFIAVSFVVVAVLVVLWNVANYAKVH